MIRHFLINKYLSKEFLKIVFNASLIFMALGFVMNLFEEINFFKDFNVNISIPLLLSFLIVPSLLNNFFPFVILISGIWFFLGIKKNDELTAINVSGISNISIIVIPCFLSIILGIFFITALNPITSVMIKKYETIKGSFEKDQEYLAAITENGIWIKEKNLEKNNIIRAAKLEGENLVDVSIYEFDKNNKFIKRIEAKTANISSLKWSLNNARIITSGGESILSESTNILYVSMYDIKKIKSLYSNLDTISFWSISKEIKLLEERGYSSREMKVKLHKSIAFPFFLLSMSLLSSVFTLGTKFSESNWSYVFYAIISSILIFFFNDFSAALGKTERLPLEVSVWMPILIIFIFSFIGLIHANQK